MNCHHFNFIVILIWELMCALPVIVSERICSIEELFDCSSEETCVETPNSSPPSGVCKCKKNLERETAQGSCLPLPTTDPDHPVLPTPEEVYSHGTSASAIAAGLLVPLFVITVVALVIASKKYRWVHRVRERARQVRARHYDTVLVNQEDDPPLA